MRFASLYVSRLGKRFASIGDGIEKKTISEKEYDTFLLKKQEWKLKNDPTCPPCPIDACYSLIDGSYIGDLKTAKMLEKKGIMPQKNKKDNNVSSIGYSKKQNKWFGWSHRAIHGFGIGDIAETCFPTGNEKGKKIKTLEEAKQAASAFAESVS